MKLKPPSMPITSRGQAFVRDASTLLLPRTKPPDAPPRPRSSFVCFVDFVVKSPGRLPPHQTQKLSKMPGIRVNPTTSELLFCSLHPGRRGGTNSASSTLLDRGSHPFLGTAGYIQHPARLPQNPTKMHPACGTSRSDHIQGPYETHRPWTARRPSFRWPSGRGGFPSHYAARGTQHESISARTNWQACRWRSSLLSSIASTSNPLEVFEDGVGDGEGFGGQSGGQGQGGLFGMKAKQLFFSKGRLFFSQVEGKGDGAILVTAGDPGDIREIQRACPIGGRDALGIQSQFVRGRRFPDEEKADDRQDR